MDIDAEEQIYHIKVSIVWDIALICEVFGVCLIVVLLDSLKS